MKHIFQEMWEMQSTLELAIWKETFFRHLDVCLETKYANFAGYENATGKSIFVGLNAQFHDLNLLWQKTFCFHWKIFDV